MKEWKNKDHNLNVENGTSSQELTETKLYKRRWALVMMLAAQSIAVRILTTSIGVINNIYKAYFNLSYYVIDWFTLIQIPATVFSAFSLAVLIFNSIINSRKLFILISFCAMFSCACSLVSFRFAHLYGLIFVGQFAAGFCVPAASAIIGSLATNWFPENQIGFALNFRSGGLGVGCLLGFLIPTQIFSPADIPLQNNRTNIYNNSAVISSWYLDIQTKFLSFYGFLLLICMIILILVIVFVNEKPPKPPTVEQALKPPQPQRKLTEVIQNLTAFYKEFKDIMSSTLMIQLTVINAIYYSYNDLQKILMGEIFRDIFDLIGENSSTSLEGYTLFVFELSAVFGGFVAGNLVDKFRKNKTILCVLLFLDLISMFGLVIARQFHSITIPTIFVSNALQGISICGSYIAVLDIILQHTYPKNPALVILMFEGLNKCASVVVGEVCRLLLSYTNNLGVFVFMIIIHVIAFIIAAFLKPTHQRQIESNIGEISKEDEPLLRSK